MKNTNDVDFKIDKVAITEILNNQIIHLKKNHTHTNKNINLKIKQRRRKLKERNPRKMWLQEEHTMLNISLMNFIPLHLLRSMFIIHKFNYFFM